MSNGLVVAFAFEPTNAAAGAVPVHPAPERRHHRVREVTG
jgi:hypothetical protein